MHSLSVSWPNIFCFGILLSSILMTCPNHLRFCWLIIYVRLCTLAWCRWSLLLILSVQLIFRMGLRTVKIIYVSMLLDVETPNRWSRHNPYIYVIMCEWYTHCSPSPLLPIWPSGKLPFDCQKIAKSWHFFQKNWQKISFFSTKLPLQMAIFRRVR